MFHFGQKFRRLRNKLRWRKARKRGKTLRLRVGNIAGFLHCLNTLNIPYVVLRWFDEVPLTITEEEECFEDIDFLIDHTRLEEVVELSSRHPGKIKCDFYSPTGKRGTGYKKMPYYPPVMSWEILASRKIYQDNFYVPSPEVHFKSLAYHLTYHKATSSGIPSGTDTFPECLPAKRPYRELLEQLGDSIQLDLPKPYTLTRLHHYLQHQGWGMPYDLMTRWPKEKEWMLYTAKQEEKIFRPHAERDPNLVVFLLRADATKDKEIMDSTVALVKKHFNILKTVQLDEAMTVRILRSVRGGNWMENRGTELIPPTVALVCRDEAPEAFAPDDPRRKKYPLINNAKVLYKNDIRDTINLKFPSSKHKRIVLHASDNAMEAQHHLQAVFGPQYPSVCEELRC